MTKAQIQIPEKKSKSGKHWLARIIHFLVFVYLVLLYLFDGDPAGARYAKLSALVLMAALAGYILFRKKFVLDQSAIFLGGFFVWSGLSVFWAWQSGYASSQLFTVLQLIVLFLLLYNFYREENDFLPLVQSFIWAGVIFTFYFISFYGMADFVKNLLDGVRMGVEINNENQLGLQLAFSIIFLVWQVLFTKKKWMILLFPLLGVGLLGTGSRTAFLCALLGSFLLLLFFLKDKKFFVKALVFALLILIVALAWNLPIFSGITERLDTMQSDLFGFESDTVVKNYGDARIRVDLIKLGWEQFLKTPIAGIGLDNGRLVGQKAYGQALMLHANFIELLVDVGIVGFTFFYLFQLYPFYLFFRKKKSFDSFAILALVASLVYVINSFGGIQYSRKLFYIIMAFIWTAAMRIAQSQKEKEK